MYLDWGGSWWTCYRYLLKNKITGLWTLTLDGSLVRFNRHAHSGIVAEMHIHIASRGRSDSLDGCVSSSVHPTPTAVLLALPAVVAFLLLRNSNSLALAGWFSSYAFHYVASSMQMDAEYFDPYHVSCAEASVSCSQRLQKDLALPAPCDQEPLRCCWFLTFALAPRPHLPLDYIFWTPHRRRRGAAGFVSVCGRHHSWCGCTTTVTSDLSMYVPFLLSHSHTRYSACRPGPTPPSSGRTTAACP